MAYYIIGGIILVLLIVVFSARKRIQTIYAKYMKVSNKADITGKQLALAGKEYLKLEGLQFSLIEGKMTDGYSHKYKTLFISDEVANTASLASVAIVAHELGHAMQDFGNDRLYHLTHIFNRITRFTNKFILPCLIVGIGFLLFEFELNISYGLLYTSLGLFCLHLLLKVLTIPMERNASHRALKFLKQYKIVSNSEHNKARKLLRVAGQTYITALFDGIFITFNKTKRFFYKK